MGKGKGKEGKGRAGNAGLGHVKRHVRLWAECAVRLIRVCRMKMIEAALPLSLSLSLSHALPAVCVHLVCQTAPFK